MKVLKKLGLIVIIAVFAVLLYFRLRPVEEVQYETRPYVEVETPGTSDITLYTELTGQVEPRSRASVQPKIGGEVLEVYVQAGDRVEEGDVLCRIDSDSLTSLKLQVDAAAVALKDAESTLARTRALYAGGFVSDQSMEQVENSAQSARISLDSAETAYNLQLEYTTVLAPISGIIESRSVDAHDHVGTDTVLCEISGDDMLQVKFGITEKILSNMQTGDTVAIEKNGTAYTGVVSEIGSMVNSSTGLYDVKADVAESNGLTTGTRVKLTVVMDRTEDAMVVPLDAVSYDSGTPFVYVYENGIAVKTDLESGIYDSEIMEVYSGLSADTQVIVTWSNELSDGVEVLIEGEDTQGEDALETQAATGKDGQVRENG